MAQNNLVIQLISVMISSLPVWGVLVFGLFLWGSRRDQRPRAANLVLAGIVLLALGQVVPIAFWQLVGQHLIQHGNVQLTLRVVTIGLSIPGAVGLLCLLLAAFDTSVSDQPRYDDWDDGER